ncbi:MAG: DUF6382 domain-containing protein [Eubacteriales bacterium]|nr:DUF6382 domain-containing protein [Eubacteriales bacterium]
MYTEYKRDMNHNYLVLHGEKEIDTSSYQVRMMVGNVVPSLIKCRIQGVNGDFSVYYDITSRQALASFYENRKLGQDEVKLIFGEFIRVMEDMAEYLMNPEQLVLMPEYMFLEVEKREIGFCFLPGYKKDLREQFQELTEYILPKINHEDDMAVRIGYGIYRRAMEDSFHLEHIKEELYRGRDREADKDEDIALRPHEKEREEQKIQTEETAIFGTGATDIKSEQFWRDSCRQSMDDKNEKFRNKKNSYGILKKIAGIAGGSLVLSMILAAKMLGYLSGIELSVILGILITVMGAGMLAYTVAKKLKKKKEEERKQDSERDLRRAHAKAERKEQEEKNVFREKTERDTEGLGRMPLQFRAGTIQENKSTKNVGETVVLSMNNTNGPPSLVSREPGELATIYIEKELVVIGKLQTASDAVIDLPTVSRVHAKIKKKEEGYYLTDLNSRNGTTVNGRLLKAEEEYCLQNEDEVAFAQARYVFLE